MKAATEPPFATIVADARVVIDVLLLDLDAWRRATPKERGSYPVRPDHIRNLTMLVRAEAIAQYLRRFPTARANGVHVSAYNEDTREWQVVCLFCRTDLNTFGKSARPPASFWIPIELHGQLCGARFLAGDLEPVGPGSSRGEKQKAVSKLFGNALISAARDAAIYLGRPEPRVRRDRKRRGGVSSGTTATELRALVSEARRLAKQRAKEAG